MWCQVCVEVAPGDGVLGRVVAEQRAPRDARGLGDVVDADVVEPACGEQVERDVGDVVLRGRAAPTDAVLRNPAFTPSIHPFISALDAIFLRSRSQLSRPAKRKGAYHGAEPAEPKTDTELVTETLVEEVSIDGMCGVY